VSCYAPAEARDAHKDAEEDADEGICRGGEVVLVPVDVDDDENAGEQRIVTFVALVATIAAAEAR
jgi:hypothetical protein